MHHAPSILPRKYKGLFSRLALGAIIATALVGCAAGRVEVASFYDTTGQQSALGTPAARGAELAVSESRVPSATYDTKSSPDESRAAAERALRTASVGVGATDSDIALPAARAFAAAGRAFFIAGATDPTLPERCGRGAYMVAFGDDAQAVAAADFIKGRFGARTLVVADEKYDYTRVLAAFFTRAYTKNGGKVVDRIDPRAQGFAREFTALAGESRPDAVFLALEPDLIPTVLAAVRKALPTTPLVGGDAFDFAGIERTDASSADAAGSAGGGLYFTTHAWLGDGAPDAAREFAAAYRARFGEEPTAFAALGYDAARLAQRVAALDADDEGDARGGDREADDDDENENEDEDEADDEDETEDDDHDRAGRDGAGPDLALVEQWLRILNPPFEGVTGTIRYDNGPVPDKDVWILEARGGRKSLAERARPDRAKAR
jgi:branched-chain amino acid transport system substrate-binding protein